MVRPVSSNQQTQDSCNLCNPWVRITGVALLAIGASVLAAALSRDPIALRQTISLIWASFMLYALVECIFADVFIEGSGSSYSYSYSTGPYYGTPRGDTVNVYVPASSSDSSWSSYSGSSGYMPPSPSATESYSRNSEETGWISNYGKTGGRSSFSTDYNSSSGIFNSSSWDNTVPISYPSHDQKTGGFGKTGGRQ